jgi:class 3 adenylate cyclase
MSNLENQDEALKQIKYYKERLKTLSRSLMSLEFANANLSKDVLQMSEGLRVISELQLWNKETKMEVLLDLLAEKINVRLKMDVTLMLMPVKDAPLEYAPHYIKSYADYNKEWAFNVKLIVPEAFHRSKVSLIANEDSDTDPLVVELRNAFQLDHFILCPVIHDGEVFTYIFTGRRKQLLQSGKGILPYHQNILEAIGGVISAVQNQIDRNLILEKLVDKRTEELRKEKELSESLLLNILPYETTKELKANGYSKAKDYDIVTVLFTDFVGFTVLSSGLSPQELVTEIDHYYRAFDDITHKYGIEKIKTIGDSYMCASGLPVEKASHAEDAVSAAIEIRDFVERTKEVRKAQGRPFFEIRIGLNSGPVIAGIVGIKKFSYDIWGDTVNVASRMESKSNAGKINISQSTYELVKDKFDCSHRGKLDAKNKGLIDMYFVEPRS